MPLVPSAMCQSISRRYASRSSVPSSCIGVTIATMLPLIMMVFVSPAKPGILQPRDV
jgi:hypothetical protein